MGLPHLWFTCSSPAGPVFVAHRGRRVSGLLIAAESRRGRKPAGDAEEFAEGSVQGFAEEFARYMRHNVGGAAEADPDPDPAWVARVGEALAAGRTDVPVDLSSRSPFHREVLLAAADIPSGEVRTYSELASAVGRPRAARAAGQAMARNPVPLLIPCHRVVPASGGVGNYGYGPDLKRKLLAREGVVI